MAPSILAIVAEIEGCADRNDEQRPKFVDGCLGMRSETWTVGFAGYCVSKTALNMLTVKLAKELDRGGIKVNAVDPGLTSTDMTGNGPGHSPEEGARPAVALATTHAYGPTAGFYACAPSGELVQKNW